MAGSKVFSLEGKGLKLTAAEDIEPHIKELKDNPDVEEVHFLGNTLGIRASEALAKVLETKKKLQVCLPLSTARQKTNTCYVGCKPSRYLHRSPPR